MANARAKDTAFQHYAITAGENKGDSPKFNQKSELSFSLNVEIRNGFLSTRYGSSILTRDASSGYPNPLAGNPVGLGNFWHKYGNPATYEEFSVFGTSIYKGSTSLTAVATGLSSLASRYDAVSAGDIFYITNGIDDVKYYDPKRSTTQFFTAGFDTPGSFTASAGTAGSMATGRYSYFVTWYDQNTETESNIQDADVAINVVGPTGSVVLSNLPICSENRVSHWVIYRKDPSGYRWYELATVDYVSTGGTYTDVASTTGIENVAPTDNFKPDPSIGVCKHGKLMIYYNGDTVTWSKNFRLQDVPTYNRERLLDTSSIIEKIVSFRDDVAVVFKSDSLYVILGDLNDVYSIKAFSKERGTLSPNSVVVTSAGVYFLDSTGKPRFITPTDFSATDLRDDSDISYKFSKRFLQIPPSQYPNCFAVMFDSPNRGQYRLFVPIKLVNGACDYCFVYDEFLARSNQGASAWFAFEYGVQMMSAAIVDTGSGRELHVLDNYGLMWKLEDTSRYSDGESFFFEEEEAVITYGANTITISTAAFRVNQLVGVPVSVCDPYTYRTPFKTRITANTGTILTCEDSIPSTLSTSAAINIGGYFCAAISTNFTHNHVGVNRPWRLSQFFDVTYPLSEIQSVVVYDMADVVNYSYSYINNPANPSLTPLADNYGITINNAASRYDTAIYDADAYSIAIGFSVPAYDTAVYNSSEYGAVEYGNVAFFLRNKYYFTTAAFGVVSRKPDAPFGYGGGTLFYQPIGAVL